MSSHWALGSLLQPLLASLEDSCVPAALLWVNNPHRHKGSSSGNTDLTFFSEEIQLLHHPQEKVVQEKLDGPRQHTTQGELGWRGPPASTAALQPQSHLQQVAASSRRPGEHNSI